MFQSQDGEVCWIHLRSIFLELPISNSVKGYIFAFYIIDQIVFVHKETHMYS